MSDSSAPRVVRSGFGALPGGQPVDLFTLTAGAVEARIAAYGATLVSLRTPDRDGAMADVVLGFDNLSGYLGEQPYLGATIGRVAGRIPRARFTLDGAEYGLAANDGRNTLHGGRRGFDKHVWTAGPFETPNAAGVALRRISPDGEEGFPGNLDVSVTYTLTPGGTLSVEYAATTDAPTPVALTNHSYFNLSGDARRDVLGHVLTVDADRFLPVDAGLIPTGERRAVVRTPFDFGRPHALGARIASDDPQLAFGRGYDHAFVLALVGPDTFHFAARLEDPASGRTMEVWTTEPALQFYAGGQLDGSVVGRGGVAYHKHAGVALETQPVPPGWYDPAPSSILRPGEAYRSRTEFRFGTTEAR